MSLEKENISIAIIQSKLIWEDRSKNRSIFEDQILSIAQDVDLIVLPEMFSTAFTMNTECAETMEGETIQWMHKMAGKKNAVICGSLIVSEEDKFFNRLIWISPDGSIEYYDKRHLFSFAQEDQYFEAGNQRKIVTLNSWRINLNICYDLRFPVALRYQDDYDCLLFVANWPSKRSHHWKTLLQARAIENLSYVIACNRVGQDDNNLDYSGDSVVLGPDGMGLTPPSNESTILITTLSKDSLLTYRNQFAFAADADSFTLAKTQ